MKEDIPALTRTPASEDAAAQSADAAPASAVASAPGEPISNRPVPPARRGAGGLALLLAAVAAAAAAVAGWQAWQTRTQIADLRDELARRLSAADTVAGEARALSRQQQEAIATLQGKLGALESKLATAAGQAAALEALYQEFSRSREDRALAEVEQAIVIADQQLALAGNVQAALIALQSAESRLALLDRGQLAPLRRAIVRDIEQLRSVAQSDVQGMALRLERMLEGVDALPLAYAGELATPQPGSEETASVLASQGAATLDFITSLLGDIWREIKTLVRVERLDRSEPVLLAPAQSTFLRENLKIRLLTARLALLARDGRNFQADLAQARQWVERFFDTRDERVQTLLAELDKLGATPVAIDHGVILDSVPALRLLQARPANGGAEGISAGDKPAAAGHDAAAPAGH